MCDGSVRGCVRLLRDVGCGRRFSSLLGEVRFRYWYRVSESSRSGNKNTIPATPFSATFLIESSQKIEGYYKD